MLKNIDPLLSPALLQVLASMGHGDELVLADANFPGDACARSTVHGRVLRCDATSVAEVARAVLSLLPLDTFVDDPAGRMEVVGAPDEIPPVQQEVQAVVDAAEGRHIELVAIERHAFYARAKSAYCVVQTGERRFYGCFLLKKGVVAPE